VGLDAALDGFWEAADADRLGTDAIQVVASNGGHGERRRIDDPRAGSRSGGQAARAARRICESESLVLTAGSAGVSERGPS